MATPPSSLSFVVLIVSAITLSCNGAAHLPRTKRTVELIEGAKDFILRCDPVFLFFINVIIFILTRVGLKVATSRMAEINATPGRLVWVQVNDENYKGYGTEGLLYK